jgi:hypothetical protein
MSSGDSEHHHGDPDDLFADMMNLAYNVFLQCPITIKKIEIGRDTIGTYFV